MNVIVNKMVLYDNRLYTPHPYHFNHSIQNSYTFLPPMTRSRTSDDALFNLACTFSLAQLPIMMALISYYRDPLFAMYTTNLLNITTKEMDIEVEDFSASILYTIASASAALFAMASKRTTLDSDTPE